MTNVLPKDEFEQDPQYQSGLKKQCPLCTSLNVKFYYDTFKGLGAWCLDCQDADCRGMCLLPGEENDFAAKHKAEITFAVRVAPKDEHWRDHEFN